MNGIILYYSKYGTTKKYASWLKEATSLPLVSLDEASDLNIEDYNLIVLGSPIYASGVKGLKLLNKHNLKNQI